jgi:hypothetical protein
VIDAPVPQGRQHSIWKLFFTRPRKARRGRPIGDNIVTNTLLPELSRHILNRALEKAEIEKAKVDIQDGKFAYEIS